MSCPSDMAHAMYKCKLCDKTFDQPQTLALHEKHHDYKFQCGFCARKMKTEREFLRHEATHAESSPSTHVRKPKDNKAQKSNNDSEALVRRDETKPLPCSEESKPHSQQSNSSSQSLRSPGSPSRDSRASSREGWPPSHVSKVSSHKSSVISGVRPSDSKKDGTSSRLQSNEVDEVFKKAAQYDEVQKKCLEMEKEIEALKAKYDISDDSDSDDIPRDNVDSLVEKNITPKDEAYEISDSEVSHPSTDEEIVWDDIDKTVPRNWKAGMSKVNGKRKIFKSPEGFVFQTRVKALEFMMNGNYPENLLCLMKNNLSEEGWVHDRSCPIRWKTRKTVGLVGGGDFEYLSPGLEVIPTMQEMLAFMKSKEGFDLRVVKKLEEKITGMSAENSKKPGKKFDHRSDPELKQMNEVEGKREKADMQSEGEILPAGWSKKWIGHANVFVSPDGNIVHTIQQVINAVEIDKSTVAVKQDSKENVKPTNAEKRKFEDFFAMNKKGRLDSPPKVVKQKSEGFSAEQVKILEEVHARSLYPDDQKIMNISQATSLTEREVKKWFVKKAAEQSRSLLKSKKRNSPSHDSPNQGDSSSGLADPHAPSTLSQQHISTLNDIFKSKPYPSSENFKQIADRLGIEKQLIVNWFRKRRIEKQTEIENEVKNNDGDQKSQPKAPVNVSADKNDIITEDQERSLQAVLARTKTPTHQDYKGLVRTTGLNRLKIERWFNFHK